MAKPPASVHKIGEHLRGAPAAPRKQQVLPQDCPVQPLGIDGSRCWFLDASGQLISATPQQLGRRWLSQLFTPHVSYIEIHWPRRNEKGEVTGMRPEACADDCDVCVRPAPFVRTAAVRRACIRRPRKKSLLA
jgi:hypothetical protein